MTQVIQIKRTEDAETAPTELASGELAVNLVTAELWVGVPVAIDPTGMKRLLPVDTGSRNYLSLSGGTITGPLLLAGDPTESLHPVTKQYFDLHMPPAIDTSQFLQVSGGTVYGFLTLEKEEPVLRVHAANKGYVDDMAGANIQRINTKISKDGDTMRGLLTLWGTPIIDMHAAPKGYVDEQVKILSDRIAVLEAK